GENLHRPRLKEGPMRTVLYALVLLAPEPPKLVFQGHQARIVTIAFSPDGKTLASGSQDRTVRLWDVATGKVQAMFKDHLGEVQCVAFSPDGKLLASASTNIIDPDKGEQSQGQILVWDVAAGQRIAGFANSEGPAYSVAFSPDGQILAAGWGMRG